MFASLYMYIQVDSTQSLNHLPFSWVSNTNQNGDSRNCACTCL